MDKFKIIFLLFFLSLICIFCKNTATQTDYEFLGLKEIKECIEEKTVNGVFCVEKAFSINNNSGLYKINDTSILYVYMFDTVLNVFLLTPSTMYIYDQIYAKPWYFDEYIKIDYKNPYNKDFPIETIKKEYDKKVEKIIYKIDYKDSISVRIGNITDTKIIFYCYRKKKDKKFKVDGFTEFITDYYTFRKNDLIDFSKVKFENCNKIFENQVK